MRGGAGVSDGPGDWFGDGPPDEDDGESASAVDPDPDPDGDPPDGGPTMSGGGDPFDDDSPFDGGGDSFVDDDFERAFDAGMGSSGFDEEFDSDIPRVDLGIEGLDEMILGGVPERSLLVAIGAAGTGKTTFGLQFLHQGLENGEKGVYITLEEDREAVLRAAEEKGWPFEEYVADDRLAVVDLDPIEMANSLASIRNDLPRLVREFDAERLVLDSVSLLEMMYDDQAERRTEVFDFTKSLKDAGVTTMLTSEASENNPYSSRHGIIEYLTDGVFVLQYVRSEFRETRLAVEIQKIRNANHSRETKPYEITNEGISVYQQASIF
ncbi:KaiC domain-containing protein [Salinirubellus sp. GCM10025818]|uniref:KaiC domain-containing protein n=1 Tax=Salinirubellus TaxID=2162630 RepID=UPI00361E60BE